METVLKLKAFELNNDFVNAFRKFLGKSNDTEVTISFNKETPIDFLKPESKEEYFNRLREAIDDVDNNRNTICFTWNEFETLSKQLAK